MKKVLLTSVLFVTALAMNAKSRSWNFTNWSEATVANLKADALASKTTGWSDVEKAADAEAGAEPTEQSKDNCFWFAGSVNEDGSLSANGEVITELKGLEFNADYATKRSLAIAVNYPKAFISDAEQTYAGPAYLWLGGKNSECFTIPNVLSGTTITIEAESHKNTDARGIELYAKVGDESTKIGESFTPTTVETKTWTVDDDCDVVIKNTNGCHIYSITMDEPLVNVSDDKFLAEGGDLYSIVAGTANVGNLTIILKPGASYTISNTLTAGGDIKIEGNGAIIDASGMTKPFITLDNSKEYVKKDDDSDSDHLLINFVSITGVTINGLQNALVKDNQKTLVKELKIEDCVVQMPNNNKCVVDFNGKGYVESCNVLNSTIYATEKNEGFFAQYGSRPKNINGDWLQIFDFRNSTIVNIANGKNFCDLKQNGTPQNTYVVKNSIFVNCGKKNQAIVGMNKGQTSTSPNWEVSGNYFAWGDECVNEAEIEKAGQQNEEDIVKNCVNGLLTFADAANGDFNGTFELEDETAPEALGDPRWTITYTAAAPKPILTFKAPVGEEVSIKFGVWETEDTYSVDFGDGELQTAKVGIDNKGPVQEDGSTPSATEFKGTVAGDGTIKVYGNNDVWYLYASDGAVPTSFNQAKLMNVVQMNITGADVENVELPAYEKMTQFSFNNSPAKSVDVTKVPTLTSLTINSTGASKFEPQLESIDLSKNTELEYLSLQGNNKASGKLTSLDLTANTKLTGMGLYVQYNQISDLKLGENTLTTINVQNNQLTGLDLTKLPNLKSLYAMDNLFEGEMDLTAYETMENVQLSGNKLTGVKVNNVTKQLWIENNCITMADIPAQPAGLNSSSKTKQFKYAPQANYEVAETLTDIDLSSQLTREKGEMKATGTEAKDWTEWIENQTTEYSFVTEGGTVLVEGTDYWKTDEGKFTFIKEQAEKVQGVMTNAALPKFTGDNAFKTTPFTVSPATGISTISEDIFSGKVFNLQGVEVQPTKGLYIQSGRKFIKK